MQMIFQDPFSSLDSRMTVGDIVGEAIDIHGLASGRERTDRILAILDRVGLSKWHASRYPHEFSGGQRQRIGIARALVVEPSFIVCDEPISALDVSIQAQIINMLEEFQENMGLTYLFIAHDLSMVKHISTRIGVMYLGGLVETAGSDELYKNPLHPYTQSLLSAIPIPDPDEAARSRRIILEGEIPSPIDTPPGCKFRTRCPMAKSECGDENPALREAVPGHYVACRFI
jgi:oligopeptide transport system ATP-binding protein